MKQKTALEILKTGRNAFITGSAGTGKTYLLNSYIEYLIKHKINYAVVAPTGIAASHLGGNTIHSFFGLGIRDKVDDYFLENLIQKKYLHKRFDKLKVLIVDEVSMVSANLLDSMDRILRMFKFNNLPFGGVQVIFSGDFFQLPPIQNKANELNEKIFAYQSEVWEKLDLKVCYLEEKFRQEDDELIQILDEIRSGEVSEISWEKLKSRMGDNVKIRSEKLTRLYTHNIDVNRINQAELNKINEKSHFFHASEKGSQKNIQRIYSSSLVLPELELKKGALVIFIKNNYEKDYVNGSLGIVEDFDSGYDKLPIVKMIADGRKIIVEPEEWSFENGDGNIKARVKQIPLRLAWALTIHKSQGMTLDAAEIDLSKTFESGQGYVAISRIKSMDGLKLVGMNSSALMVNPEIISMDQKFRRNSQLIEKKFDTFSDDEKKEMEIEFIERVDGEVEEIDDKEFEEIKKKEKKEKVDTYQESLKLFKEGKSVGDISNERGISYNRIIEHLNHLIENNLIDISEVEYLKPDNDLLEMVKEAYEDILNDNNPEDFLDDGKMKLKSIFNRLDGEAEYDDIKLALIFIKK